MSKKLFISDLHFGHENMAKRRGFKDSFEMDEYIIKKWNSVVNKRDFVYILGDITMEKTKWYFYLDQLKGKKRVVLGNHDFRNHVPELLKYVDCVSGCENFNHNGNKFFLTHIPIHPFELLYRVKYNIHGHVHENTLKDDKYINVSCEQIDYTPKTIGELLKLREERINDRKKKKSIWNYLKLKLNLLA